MDACGRNLTFSFNSRSVALCSLNYSNKGLTRAHWKLFPAITSIVRDLCRRSVSTRVKLASAAGFAPAFPRSQTGYVAATLHAVCPGEGLKSGLEICGNTGPWRPFRCEILKFNWPTRRESRARGRLQAPSWREAILLLNHNCELLGTL